MQTLEFVSLDQSIGQEDVLLERNEEAPHRLLARSWALSSCGL